MNLMEVCTYLKNFFEPSEKRESRDFIHAGTFEVNKNTVSPLDFIKPGQYFRIVGSDLNDGVYCNSPDSLKTLKDEVFSGAVHEMRIPPAFISLYKDMQDWSTKNESTDSINMSPFVAESFGGYSYSKTNSRVNQSSTGNAVTWHEQFSKRLNAWRKI